ncbi:AAA domain-containing protein [Mycoplasma sp. 888]|uniref:AAA domain-containing protein n=1 Tax=Mycoplasma sp. 888 TaxID=3108483 RepID=UPI002D78A4AF|nr:AAA domain-containing protein [Mycoplasma sp. 888]WRQ25767.1 AAA domain-containing protein [Mycoplasma sp. 888]
MKLKTQIQEIQNNINHFKKQIKHTKNLIEVKSKTSEEIKNTNKEINEDITKYQKELHKAKDYLNNFENKLKEINENILTLKNNLSVKESSRISINKEISFFDELKSHKNQYKNMLDSFIDEKEFNLYEVSLKLKINTRTESETFSFPSLQDKDRCKQFGYDANRMKTYFCDFTDIGFKAIMSRYKFALRNTLQGYYKNPSIIHSLLKPSEIEADTLEIVSEAIKNSGIINKYKLNEKQIKAIQIMESARDIAYIQGPPGTGKTQVIASFIDLQVQQGNSILLTSSTHEAIENALERVNKLNSKNPSMIIIKKDRLTDLENEKSSFSEGKIYSNFLTKLKNCFSDSDDESYKEFEKYKGKLIPWAFLSKLGVKGEDLKNYKFTNQDKDLINNFLGHDQHYNLSDLFIKETQRFFERWNEPFKFLDENLNPELELKIWPILTELFRNKIVVLTFDSLVHSVQNIRKKKSNKKLNQLVNSYFEKNPIEDIDNKVINEKNNLLDYINENELVNVLGMTTTSSNSFTINGKTRDILSDYPIDVTIVDEVSKSSTPEILTRILVSNKTILCGDYKQLPPNEKLNENLFKENIDKLLEDPLKFKDKFFKYYSKKKENYEDHSLYMKLNLEKYFEKFSLFERWDRDNYENRIISRLKNDKDFKEKFNEHIYNQVEKIFNTPLFFKQIEYIKNNLRSSNNTSEYTFLNKQHRFNETIMQLVNNFYLSDEKLEIANDDFEFNKNQLKLIKNSSKDLFYVDTSYLASNYLKTLEKSNVFLKNKWEGYDYNAFDQQYDSWIDFDDIKKPSLKNSGLLNQYNAFTILKIVQQITENNKNQKEKIIDKIGIICLTTNQKKVVSAILKSKIDNFSTYKIKIDTIDNFQGREKEIVIVDFVRARDRLENKNNQLVLSDSSWRNMSFLEENERLNVAVSRAKKALILVGAFDYYHQEISDNNSLLVKYIKHFKTVNNQTQIEVLEGRELW